MFKVCKIEKIIIYIIIKNIVGIERLISEGIARDYGIFTFGMWFWAWGGWFCLV